MDTPKTARKTTKIGTVIARKMQKTVTVQVERQVRHPLYRKTIRRKQTFLVHDEAGACKVGDVVRIIETRPVSKTKRWRVCAVIGLTPELTASPIAENPLEIETAGADETAGTAPAEPGTGEPQ